MVCLLCGAGVRVLECCRLRVQAIDFVASQIVVRAGKGDKDRVTMLPAVTKADLSSHLAAIRPQHREDVAAGADLISQLPESVVPDGSQWRALAKNRWGANGPRQEAHVVYYVFQRLFDEAKTEQGRHLAREKWDVIRPELLKLMNLGGADDPVKVLGVPKAFQ